MASRYDRFQASAMVKELGTACSESLFHHRNKTTDCVIPLWGVPINVTQADDRGNALLFYDFFEMTEDLYALVSSRWREEQPGEEVKRTVHMTMCESGSYHRRVVEDLEKALTDRLAREMPDLDLKVDAGRRTWTIQKRNP